MQDEKLTNKHFLPWYNFQTINFLETYIRSKMNIFEYGCGFSTLYYATKKCNVYGVDTKQLWTSKITKISLECNMAQYIKIELCTDITNFYKTVMKYDIEFDVVVIDSIQRIKCLQLVKNLYKKGIMILDNSERKNLQNAKEIMCDFKFYEFKGPGPSRTEESQSLIFYK